MDSNKIVAVVLAAGLSSRMGNNKLLMPLGNKTVIEHVIQELLKTNVDSIMVVGGNEFSLLQSKLESYPLNWVYNKSYREGQSLSIKAAVAKVMEMKEVRGILFVMGDQPLLDYEEINGMIRVFNQYDQKIVVPVDVNQKRGAPVLFHRHFFNAFFDLHGDQGGKKIIVNHPESVIEYKISKAHFFWDVDTAASYNTVKDWWYAHEK